MREREVMCSALRVLFPRSTFQTPMALIDPNSPISSFHRPVNARTSLVAAAAEGHLQEVERLMRENTHLDINARDDRGVTALVAAAAHGRLTTVERLLALGADPDLRVEGRSALHVAILGNSPAMVSALLDHDADLHQRLDMHRMSSATPLMLAAENSPDIVNLLLSRGADPEAVDGFGYTALMHAVWGGNTTIVTTLARRSEQIDRRSNEGKSAFRYAFERNSRALMRVLLDEGADIDQESPPESGDTVLSEVIGKGHLSKARWLMEQGANPNGVAGTDRTPLRDALGAPRGTDMMRLLLENGAEARLGEEQGHSVLAVAAAERNEEAIHLLIAHGADPRRIADRLTATDLPAHEFEDVRLSALQVAAWFGYVDILETLSEQEYDLMTPVNRHHDTALHLAVWRQNREVVEWLLPREQAADRVNSRNDLLDTPLLHLQEGDLAMARLLVQRGANVNLADQEGTTPLLMAVHHGDEQIVEFLLSQGAICTADQDGRDVLHWAIKGDGNDVMALLRLLADRIGDDIDINARDRKGRTPLMRAVRAERIDVVQFLLAEGAAIDLQDRDGRTALQFARAAEESGMELLMTLLGSPPRFSDAQLLEGHLLGRKRPRQQ